MEREMEKLLKLLPHWIEHNEEHAGRFLEWAGKARAMGAEETARRIERAVELIRASNQELTAALKELEARHMPYV